jgi:hypothetical protein
MFIIIHLYYYVICFKYIRYLKQVKIYYFFSCRLIQNLLTHM